MGSVIVTGGKGLLGTTLLRALKECGHQVKSLVTDVRDTDAVMREVEDAHPVSCIIHTASKTNVAACEQNPEEAFAVNAEGTAHIVRAAKNMGAKLMYASTVSVFDGEFGGYRESDIPGPKNVYNQSKYEGELAVRSYKNGIVVRFNMIGIHPDGSRGQNFLEWLTDAYIAGKDITLFDDVYINSLTNLDVARFFLKIMELKNPPPVLHLGSREVVSKVELGDMVREHFPKYTGTVRHGSVDDVEDGVWRPKQMWLDTSASAAVVGPMPSLKESINEVLMAH